VLAIYDGTLFVGIGGGATDSLRQYPLSGFLAKPLTPTLVLTEGISGPTGVAFTRQPRTVLVADYYSGFVTHYGLPHGHALPTITDNVYAPEGIAVDTSGNIYVADSAKNRIGVYSPAGVFKFSF
jgi:sugar lactone lactonase YvrE